MTSMHYLMQSTLLLSGTRVSELINLKLDYLNLSENTSIKLYSKGNKVRIARIDCIN